MHLICFLTVGIHCGCGAAGEPATPIDVHDIRTLVGYVAEYHANPVRLEALFVDGAILDKATRDKLRGMMSKLQLALVDDTGSSATVEVDYEVLATGDILGPVEWNLAKTSDQWKVSVFALPGGSAQARNRRIKIPNSFSFLGGDTHANTMWVPTSKANRRF